MLHSQVRQQGGQQNYPHLGLDTIEAQWGVTWKGTGGVSGEKGYVEGKKAIWKTDSKHQGNDFTLKSRDPSCL